MKINEKLFLNYQGLVDNGAITIVAFGDSVTHGAFSEDEIDYQAVYHNLLKNKLNAVNNYVPVNVINAGIGGITATRSLDRIERDVISHHPDLVIVCFGLNDVNDELDLYLNSLKTIFLTLKNANCDVVFLTPNMLNTYVADDTSKRYYEYAKVTAEMQNSGKMDLYMQKAVELATSLGVTVCDCYSVWKNLSKTTDTTMLLANRINHPTKQMHELFASELFKVIMGENYITNAESESTMYK